MVDWIGLDLGREGWFEGFERVTGWRTDAVVGRLTDGCVMAMLEVCACGAKVVVREEPCLGKLSECV